MSDKTTQMVRKEKISRLLKESTEVARRKIEDLATVPISNRQFNRTYGTGESILSRDWDILLLLDACRYDKFCEICPIDPSHVEHRVTLGSRTPSFLRRTFDERTCHDIVYITANPQPLRYDFERNDKPFNRMVSVLDEWDAEIQTIHPRDVRNAALDAAESYPEKRLIIHFLQPHAPFLGPTAAKIRERTGTTVCGLDPGREYTAVQSQNVEATGYRGILREHQSIDIEDIITAYLETLAIVTVHAINMAGRFTGKVALTADHGELLGDRLHLFGSQRWEHPGGIRTPELCTVPWVEFPFDKRRDICSEPPEQETSTEQEMVNTRLQALGYVN